MRFKQQLLLFLALATLSSALLVKPRSKKSENEVEHLPESLVDRQGLHSENTDSEKEVKKEDDELKPTSRSGKKEVPVEAVPAVELPHEDSSDEDKTAKADLNRESRGDKNPRIYYDDTAPKYHHPSHDDDDFHYERSSPEGKSKEGKLYFPKHYLESKFSHGSKKGHQLHLAASGKRAPDHIHFDDGHSSQEYSSGHGHGHPLPESGVAHHDEHHGPIDEAQFGHGIEDHHEKGHHHVSGYGYHHHHGSFRHTIGDKVDAVGKALQVLIPSALLITGVSALFPNRVHVPTTPNKYRQKRSVFRRRIANRGGPPPSAGPSSHIPPELEDIPTHILRAEHRIMDGSNSEMFPEYGQKFSASEDSGFNPFKVFKGPGPEATANKIQQSIPMPLFPDMPDMSMPDEKSQEYVGPAYEISKVNKNPSSTFRPNSLDTAPPTSPTPQRMIPLEPRPTSNLDEGLISQRQNIPIRRRKPVRKTPAYVKDALNSPSQLPDIQKSQYLIKNSLDISKQVNEEKAAQELMSSLQNLVTPDVAQAIVESKTEPPKNVDLSPDSPVMGLLSSYAQHENDSPACQKRALCELAVKGKDPKSTKFEAFLWSVATLVPDVFSQMYDLQEVFHAIKNERCSNFACANPNLDIQA